MTPAEAAFVRYVQLRVAHGLPVSKHQALEALRLLPPVALTDPTPARVAP